MYTTTAYFSGVANNCTASDLMVFVCPYNYFMPSYIFFSVINVVFKL